jgi:ferric-dicitrate binding protein FerR (iron transport regulator)
MTAVGRFATCLALALYWNSLIAGSASAEIIGAVTGLSGSANVERPSGAAPLQLALHSAIHEGDLLRTGPGARLRITLRDDTVLSLGADAELNLNQFAPAARPGGVGRLFTLAFGYLRTVVGRLQPDTVFEIRSPSMVAAVRGTDWIESYAGGTTEIFVADGRVLATGTVDRDSNWVLLNAGEGVSFIAGAPHTPVVRWGQEKINRFVEATRVP